MFVVLFEVQPRAEHWDRYLALAATLRPELTQIRGFIDNERYRSEHTHGWLLSLSTWQDEKALIRWRTHARHHKVQEEGRFEVLQDYRLRVGEVISDSCEGDLTRNRLDLTEVGAASAVTVTETPAQRAPPRPPAPSAELVDTERYTPISDEGRQTCCSPRGAPTTHRARGSSSNLTAHGTATSASSATTDCSNATRRPSTTRQSSMTPHDQQRRRRRRLKPRGPVCPRGVS